MRASWQDGECFYIEASIEVGCYVMLAAAACLNVCSQYVKRQAAAVVQQRTLALGQKAPEHIRRWSESFIEPTRSLDRAEQQGGGAPSPMMPPPVQSPPARLPPARVSASPVRRGCWSTAAKASPPLAPLPRESTGEFYVAPADLPRTTVRFPFWRRQASRVSPTHRAPTLSGGYYM